MSHTFLKKIAISKINLFDKGKIANEFKKCSAKIGIEIPSKIPTAKTTFETYM